MTGAGVSSSKPGEAATETAAELGPDALARIAAVPLFAATDWQAEPLPGGLTNVNAKVITPGGCYVVRLSTPSGSLLAIDRDVELAASQAAAAAGVGPRVVAHDPAGVLVIEWVEGHTLTEADLRAGTPLPRVAATVRQLHAGPRLPVDFDMFAIQRRYLAVVTERAFRLPARYHEFEPLLRRIEAALAVHPVPLVPCHNDLLAANLIDAGDRIWIIDFEYAGNNDPYFELGNLWSESNLAPEQLTELVAHYHGAWSEPLVARARLWGLIAKYGWTLWASIQDGVSDLEFDFWSWGLEKYHRAVSEFDSADVERWIAQVQQAA
jgi:thiamine kinase-like enzyme